MASSDHQPANLQLSPTRASKRPFYGMFHKTRKKPHGGTTTTSRGGGRGRRRHDDDVMALEGEYDSVGSSYAATANDIFVVPPRSTGGGGGGGGGVALESSKSFYFSPLNSWNDHRGQHARGGSSSGNINFGSCRERNNDDDNDDDDDDDDMNAIVCLVERVLRQIFICLAMFVAGTVASERGARVAYHALELSLVAWGTCLCIILLTRFRNHRQHQRGGETRRSTLTTTSATSAANPVAFTPLINNMSDRAAMPGNHLAERLAKPYTSSNDTEHPPPRKKRPYHDESSVPPKLIRKLTLTPERTAANDAAIIPANREQRRRQHPHLENLHVICQRERVFPNAPVDIDTEFFSGKMLLLFRTPDADEQSSNLGSNTTTTTATADNDDHNIANYFRGKQRRFEFQWQLRLKKLVPGDVFMGVEVDEPIQMGMIQRALANAALAFTKKTNQGFSYRFSDSAESGPSCLSFPVATSMDRFNATKVGEPLPLLGQAISEDTETMKLRKKGGKIEWSTDYVYTMALWSAYADWSDWQILNFPGIRPFSITSMVGVQPIKLTLYSQQNLDREVIIAMEVSHATLSTLGSEAQRWTAENDARGEGPSIDTIDYSENDSINANESCVEEEEMDDDDDKCNEDLEIEDALELDDPQTSLCVLSGTSVFLREGATNYVASGGGYAVLQSNPPPFSFFVLEKIQPKAKKRAPGPTTAIRSGDVVRVQLVDATSKDVKYLTIHQGWWLRWSAARPKRNGLFYIRTGEPNGSLVVLGCPFSLASRRWSHYTIGACFESSAKYGGRLLGIYKTGKVLVSDDIGNGEDEDGHTQDNELYVTDHLIEKSSDKRMMPLLLCAEPCHSPALPPVQTPDLARNLSTGGDTSVQNPCSPTIPAIQKHYEVDVPVWLEMMNRTERKMQLVYAVRFNNVLTHANEGIGSDTEKESCATDENQCIARKSRFFVTLRTGRELASILRLGIDCKGQTLSPSSDDWQQGFDLDNQDELHDAESFTSSSVDFDSDEMLDGDEHVGDDEDGGPTQFESDGSNHGYTVPRVSSFDQDLSIISAVDEQEMALTPKGEGVSYIKRAKSAEDFSRCDIRQDDLHRQVGALSARKKNRSVHTAVGLVAKTVKSSTVITGKHVLKHSMNITKGTVKGTVIAGRAAGRVIPVSSVVYGYKQPRKHEPGECALVVHVIVENYLAEKVLNPASTGGKLRKPVKRNVIDRAIKNIECTGKFSTSLLSGQLLAPDQSCRKVSQILSDISNTPSSQWAISQLAETNSTHDLSFLRGSAAELGVKPLKQVDPVSDISCAIARCIYEGRWREELCVLYTKDRHLAFYAPLAKKPSLAVSFEEITSARVCEEHMTTPLPGLYTLAIDTAWKCHYLTFLEVAGREYFLKNLNDALFHTVYEEINPRHSRKVAPEFESYRMSLETSLTGTVGKWRAVSTGKKSNHKKQRRVLNNRRMAFDLVSIMNKGDTQEKVASYVENLLKLALSFSPDTLNASESRFVQFLDEASRLRTLPLHEIDLSSKEALCIFVNLYHCLLQHSLLLAVDGLPNKRSVMQFKRCSCYEIGEDVFSLAELECCVIRGNTSRPSHIKPPFADAPKTSRPYRMYGLSATDFRINFILNNGDVSYPSRVPVYKQQNMDEQMDLASSCFLMEQVKIDKRKRTVFLPKVCDVYALDFGMGDGLVCVSQCLIYLDEQSQLAIAALLENRTISIKYNQCPQNFHPSLIEDRLAVE